jgi:hypothetical protein
MRSHSRLAALCAALIGLMAVVGPVSAADPVFSVEILGSKPLEVTAGEVVAYPVRIAGVNNTQTVNHVFVDASVPGATYRGATTTVGTCSQTIPLCDLGTYRPDSPAALVVLMFTAPTATTIDSINATVTVHSGEGTKDSGNAAHSDTFSDTALTNVHHGGTSTFFSRYVLARSFSSGETGLVQTDQAITAANPHATQVIVPDDAVVVYGAPVTISEALVAPGADCRGFPCFGQTSTISVADGATFTSGFVVKVTFGAPELPSGMNAKKLHVIHNLDASLWEPVDAACGAVPVAPCRLSTVTLRDKSIVVTMFLGQNGNIKGY